MHFVLVSGLLGVGKTTVILNMMDTLYENKGHRIMVIENDFGNKGIDGEVMRKYGMDVQELKGGCICCTLKTGLIDTVRVVQANMDPDLIIVEPTGIADPEIIINSVQDCSGIEIDRLSTIIVVDAERFAKTWKMFERPLRNQLKVADLVLINKMDTVSESELKDIEERIISIGYEGPVKAVQADKGINMEHIMELFE